MKSRIDANYCPRCGEKVKNAYREATERDRSEGHPEDSCKTYFGRKVVKAQEERKYDITIKPDIVDVYVHEE